MNAPAWWLLGISFAVSAGTTHSIASLLVIICAVLLIAVLAREAAPWSQSLRFYMVTALAVVTIRVVFRIVFNFDTSSNVALNLQSIDIALGDLGSVELFGRVSWDALTAALRDGLKMAAIVLSIGMANTLANPKRLLKNTPGALYEVASALVIAINMAPQLIASTQRVKQARLLRGRSGRQRLLSSLIIPVLEDTLERSLALAASMDARGFGRQGSLSKTQKNAARFATLVSIAALGVGSYLLLATVDLAAALVAFAIGLLALMLSIKLTSLKHVKTSYRKDPWRFQDWALVAVSTALIAFALGGAI